MELGHHITAIQSDLAAAAALGGEATADAGRRLSDALESSLQLRLLDVLTEAALGLNASLPDGHIEVRLAGRDPSSSTSRKRSRRRSRRPPSVTTWARGSRSACPRH